MGNTVYGQRMLSNLLAEGALVDATFVMIATVDAEVKTATAGAKIIGIATDAVADDGHAAIAYSGEYKIKLLGTVTRGDYLKASTDGKGIKADTDLDEYGAEALESGVTGDVIRVLINKGVYGV